MLSSKKLTFSLTSLLVLIAFSFAYVVSPVMAHDVVKESKLTDLEKEGIPEFKVWLSVDESVQDVSSDDGVQIASSRTRQFRTVANVLETAVSGGAGRIIVLTTFEKPVHLQDLDPRAKLVVKFDGTVTSLNAVTQADIDDGTISHIVGSGSSFGADDVVIDAFDNDGRNLGQVTLSEVLLFLLATDGNDPDEDYSIIKHKNPGGRVPGEQPGKEFLIQLDHEELENAYSYFGRGGGVAPGAGLEIHTLYFSVPQNRVTEAGQDAIAAARIGTHLHTNKYSSVLGNDDPKALKVELVDDDEGHPNYAKIRGTTVVPIVDVEYREAEATTTEAGADDGVPGVVYIDAPNVVVRGEFYANILLTEQPMDNTFPVIVDGGKGTAGDPEWLRSVSPEVLATAAATTAPDIPGGYTQGNGWSTAAEGDSGTYDTGVYAVDSLVPDWGALTDTAPTAVSVPQATGRDNMYHLYRVKVTPSGGATGHITVSVGQFDDKVLPLPNTYLPLSVQQRRATTFVGAAEQVRVARIMNSREALTIPLLGVGADTTSDLALATAGYKTRQEGILDTVVNEKVLDAKLVVPAGGYLVLGGTGINASSAKIVEKLSAALATLQYHES